MLRNIVVLSCAVLLLQMPVAADNLYVDLNSPGPDDSYLDWDTAATNIQDAVDAATEGDTIFIRPGRYTASHSPTNFAGCDSVVHMENKLINLVAAKDRPGIVLIDGEGANRGISVNRPAQSSFELLFENITVSNCVATAPEEEHAIGGGVYFVTRSSSTAWSAILRGCHITHNRADGRNAKGGGFYCLTNTGYCHLTFTNCIFSSNRAMNSQNEGSNTQGGGIYLRSFGDINIVDSLFENNKTLARGGAIAIQAYGGLLPKVVKNCIFRDNAAEAYIDAGSGGGAVHGIFIYRNCLFVGNTSVGWGGVGNGSAVFLDRTGPLHMENCTVIDNNVLSREGNVYNVGGALHIRTRDSNNYAIITNSIVYYNEPRDFDLPGGTYTNYVSHSCIGKMTGEYILTNVTTNEPRFFDRENSNYALRANSPCVNAGVNSDWMKNALDLAGNKRINWNVVDMGAYEYQITGSALILR